MSARTLYLQLTPWSLLWIALCPVSLCFFDPSVAFGQARQNQTSGLEIALAKVKSNSDDFDGADVVFLVKAGAVQAIPGLKDQFRRVTDVRDKDTIAAGLVKLGDRDDTYWNFVLEEATHAVDANVPDGAYSESLGKMMNPPPELQPWADAHNVSLNTAWQYARYDLPGKILLLGAAGDPRGIPLLRRALHARNYLIVDFAARALSQIRDDESIPLIIVAAERAPTGYREVIAQWLVYFDNAQAQGAADELLPKEKARLYREGKAHGLGVSGW